MYNKKYELAKPLRTGTHGTGVSIKKVIRKKLTLFTEVLSHM